MSKQHERKLTRWLAREKAANRAKDQFLAILSHELRTPLNPALLLASDGAHNHQLPSQVREDFDEICKNIEIEARLIDDLLDLTRIASGKLTLNRDPVDVHKILQDVVAIIDKEIAQKHIFLDLHFKAERHEILGDPVRLKQIFWNVLKNSVKFTATDGQITVESEAANHKLVVKISDTGIGMNADEIRTVFDKYSQGTHGMGGLGLGLAISRKLVKLHSGSIHADSLGKGKGAVFSIIFPLIKSAEEQMQVPAAPVRHANGKGNGDGGNYMM
ncbi:MAG TPA: HAMP domain-containing sensor histidine kinase [Verrucomicrobiae bacterium]|jgi:signal transduction histidine kinase|nr:HAMP domain-containing sensor histidine kinase [Verrucomicrobiae bacterium]